MKRGKKPKERENYILRMQNGELVEVTREVYLEWYQSRRREKYQRERDQKYKVCSLNALEETGIFFSVSVSDSAGLDELILQKSYQNKLLEALKKLPKQDVYLISLLYYEGVTIKRAAELCQCSQESIRNRRKHILEVLYQMMKKEGAEDWGI